jgi:hypothetical protein
VPVLFIAMKWLKNSGIKPQKKIRSAFEKQQPALTSGQLHSIKVHTMVEKGEKILRSDKNKNHRLFIG